MRRTPFAHIVILIAFLFNTIGALPSSAQEIVLPKPGVMVRLSPPLNPPVLKGLKVDPKNPFRFEFILDVGDGSPVPDKGEVTPSLQEESSRLIKYFLASLTTPEKDMWVNLSPYEKDRIVPESFGVTEMGRDLLAQDYLLKQVTATLIYPENEVGRKFWKRVYEQAHAKYGTTTIPVNTFNKVWIVPDKAVVYENAKAGTAYVVESKLKVMLEEDYLSKEKNSRDKGSGVRVKGGDVSGLGSQIVREIVIPELTKEINEGSNFSQLRQVYNSLILATWYKKKIKDSILSKVYADKNKVQGLTTDHLSLTTNQIYEQYIQAFKKGVYNYIKEDPDPLTGQLVPKKYFSGGLTMDMAVMTTTTDAAMVQEASSKLQIVRADCAMFTGANEAKPVDAMAAYDHFFQIWKKKLDAAKGRNPVFIIGGYPGAGKSTMAALFKKFLIENGRKAVVINTDEFRKETNLMTVLRAVPSFVPVPFKARNYEKRMKYIRDFHVNALKTERFRLQIENLQKSSGDQVLQLDFYGNGHSQEVSADTIFIFEGTRTKIMFPWLRPEISVFMRVDPLLERMRIFQRSITNGKTRSSAYYHSFFLSVRFLRDLLDEESDQYDYVINVKRSGEMVLEDRAMTTAFDTKGVSNAINDDNQVSIRPDAAMLSRLKRLFVGQSTDAMALGQVISSPVTRESVPVPLKQAALTLEDVRRSKLVKVLKEGKVYRLRGPKGEYIVKFSPFHLIEKEGFAYRLAALMKVNAPREEIIDSDIVQALKQIPGLNIHASTPYALYLQPIELMTEGDLREPDGSGLERIVILNQVLRYTDLQTATEHNVGLKVIAGQKRYIEYDFDGVEYDKINAENYDREYYYIRGWIADILNIDPVRLLEALDDIKSRQAEFTNFLFNPRHAIEGSSLIWLSKRISNARAILLMGLQQIRDKKLLEDPQKAEKLDELIRVLEVTTSIDHPPVTSGAKVAEDQAMTVEDGIAFLGRKKVNMTLPDYFLGGKGVDLAKVINDVLTRHGITPLVSLSGSASYLLDDNNTPLWPYVNDIDLNFYKEGGWKGQDQLWNAILDDLLKSLQDAGVSFPEEYLYKNGQTDWYPVFAFEEESGQQHKINISAADIEEHLFNVHHSARVAAFKTTDFFFGSPQGIALLREKMPSEDVLLRRVAEVYDGIYLQLVDYMHRWQKSNRTQGKQRSLNPSKFDPQVLKRIYLLGAMRGWEKQPLMKNLLLRYEEYGKEDAFFIDHWKVFDQANRAIHKLNLETFEFGEPTGPLYTQLKEDLRGMLRQMFFDKDQAMLSGQHLTFMEFIESMGLSPLVNEVELMAFWSFFGMGIDAYFQGSSDFRAAYRAYYEAHTKYVEEGEMDSDSIVSYMPVIRRPFSDVQELKRILDVDTEWTIDMMPDPDDWKGPSLYGFILCVMADGQLHMSTYDHYGLIKEFKTDEETEAALRMIGLIGTRGRVMMVRSSMHEMLKGHAVLGMGGRISIGGHSHPKGATVTPSQSDSIGSPADVELFYLRLINLPREFPVNEDVPDIAQRDMTLSETAVETASPEETQSSEVNDALTRYISSLAAFVEAHGDDQMHLPIRELQLYLQVLQAMYEQTIGEYQGTKEDHQYVHKNRAEFAGELAFHPKFVGAARAMMEESIEGGERLGARNLPGSMEDLSSTETMISVVNDVIKETSAHPELRPRAIELINDPKTYGIKQEEYAKGAIVVTEASPEAVVPQTASQAPSKKLSTFRKIVSAIAGSITSGSSQVPAAEDSQIVVPANTDVSEPDDSMRLYQELASVSEGLIKAAEKKAQPSFSDLPSELKEMVRLRSSRLLTLANNSIGDDPSVAKAVLREYLRLLKAFPTVDFYVAISLRDNDNVMKSQLLRPLVIQIIRSVPKDEDKKHALTELAGENIAEGNLQEALDLLQEVQTSVYLTFSWTLKRLIPLVILKAGQNDKLVRQLEGIINAIPSPQSNGADDKVELLVALGNRYDELGMKAKAQSNYTKAWDEIEKYQQPAIARLNHLAPVMREKGIVFPQSRDAVLEEARQIGEQDVLKGGELMGEPRVLIAVAREHAFNRDYAKAKIIAQFINEHLRYPSDHLDHIQGAIIEAASLYGDTEARKEAASQMRHYVKDHFEQAAQLLVEKGDYQKAFELAETAMKEGYMGSSSVGYWGSSALRVARRVLDKDSTQIELVRRYLQQAIAKGIDSHDLETLIDMAARYPALDPDGEFVFNLLSTAFKKNQSIIEHDAHRVILANLRRIIMERAKNTDPSLLRVSQVFAAANKALPASSLSIPDQAMVNSAVEKEIIARGLPQGLMKLAYRKISGKEADDLIVRLKGVFARKGILPPVMYSWNSSQMYHRTVDYHGTKWDSVAFVVSDRNPDLLLGVTQITLMDDEVVGYATIGDNSNDIPRAKLLTMQVLPQQRGQGYGDFILKEQLRLSRAVFPGEDILVEKSQFQFDPVAKSSALLFYLRNGFIPNGFAFNEQQRDLIRRVLLEKKEVDPNEIRDLVQSMGNTFLFYKPFDQAMTADQHLFSFDIGVGNNNGLHARPSARVAALASAYKQEGITIKLRLDDFGIDDASSLMAVMGLNALYGDPLTMTITGPISRDRAEKIKEEVSAAINEKDAAMTVAAILGGIKRFFASRSPASMLAGAQPAISSPAAQKPALAQVPVEVADPSVLMLDRVSLRDMYDSRSGQIVHRNRFAREYFNLPADRFSGNGKVNLLNVAEQAAMDILGYVPILSIMGSMTYITTPEGLPDWDMINDIDLRMHLKEEPSTADFLRVKMRIIEILKQKLGEKSVDDQGFDFERINDWGIRESHRDKRYEIQLIYVHENELFGEKAFDAYSPQNFFFGDTKRLNQLLTAKGYGLLDRNSRKHLRTLLDALEKGFREGNKFSKTLKRLYMMADQLGQANDFQFLLEAYSRDRVMFDETDFDRAFLRAVDLLEFSVGPAQENSQDSAQLSESKDRAMASSNGMTRRSWLSKSLLMLPVFSDWLRGQEPAGPTLPTALSDTKKQWLEDKDVKEVFEYFKILNRPGVQYEKMRQKFNQQAKDALERLAGQSKTLEDFKETLKNYRQWGIVRTLIAPEAVRKEIYQNRFNQARGVQRDQTKPLAVVVVDEFDDNNAMFDGFIELKEHTGVVPSLMAQGYHVMAVSEASMFTDVVNHIDNFTKNEKKPALLVINAHGRTGGLGRWLNLPGGILVSKFTLLANQERITQWQKQIAGRIKETILISCDTGSTYPVGNVANLVRDITGSKTAAPTKDINSYEITDNKGEIQVKFLNMELEVKHEPGSSVFRFERKKVEVPLYIAPSKDGAMTAQAGARLSIDQLNWQELAQQSYTLYTADGKNILFTLRESEKYGKLIWIEAYDLNSPNKEKMGYINYGIPIGGNALLKGGGDPSYYPNVRPESWRELYDIPEEQIAHLYEEYGLWVKHSYRSFPSLDIKGEGVGKLLMDIALKLINRDGVKKLYIRSGMSEEPNSSLLFYRHNFNTQVSDREGYDLAVDVASAAGNSVAAPNDQAMTAGEGEDRPDSISQVERKTYKSQPIVNEEQIPLLVESPLVEAVRTLYRKNIQTYQSSANLEGYIWKGSKPYLKGKAWIIVNYSGLSAENKAVFNSFKGAEVFVDADDNQTGLIMIMKLTPRTTKQEVEAKSLELARAFHWQPLNWGWMPRDEMIRIIKKASPNIDDEELSDRLMRLSRLREMPIADDEGFYGSEELQQKAKIKASETDQAMTVAEDKDAERIRDVLENEKEDLGRLNSIAIAKLNGRTTVLMDDIDNVLKTWDGTAIDMKKVIPDVTKHDFSLSAELSLDRPAQIEQKVEAPAIALVKQILEMGGKPLWSNAYGFYFKGVIWQQGKTYYFTALKQEDYAKKGGIDFTADQIPLEIRNSGQGMDFKLDPVMLKQLQNAPGFYPVILNIAPLTDLKGFLGANDASKALQTA